MGTEASSTKLASGALIVARTLFDRNEHTTRISACREVGQGGWGRLGEVSPASMLHVRCVAALPAGARGAGTVRKLTKKLTIHGPSGQPLKKIGLSLRAVSPLATPLAG